MDDEKGVVSLGNFDIVRKKYSSEIKSVGVEDDRILRFVSTSESEDRDGDIIEFDGWELDNYRKNPIVLYGHNYSGLPVGKTIEIHTDPLRKVITHDVQFATKEEYPFADTVYRLAKGGYLNATSVGFVGKQSTPRIDKDGHFMGMKFTKTELLELSIVPVPSNPLALQEARIKGLITNEEILELTKLPLLNVTVTAIFDDDNISKSETYRVFDKDGNGLCELNINEWLKEHDEKVIKDYVSKEKGGDPKSLEDSQVLLSIKDIKNDIKEIKELLVVNSEDIGIEDMEFSGNSIDITVDEVRELIKGLFTSNF